MRVPFNPISHVLASPQAREPAGPCPAAEPAAERAPTGRSAGAGRSSCRWEWHRSTRFDCRLTVSVIESRREGEPGKSCTGRSWRAGCRT